MALRRRTKIALGAVAVVLVGIAGFTYWMLAHALGVIYRPAGSQQLGAYTIKSETTEGFGHTGHRAFLYLRQPGRDYLVADSFAGGDVSPHDPMKIVYERWCEDENDHPDCGIFLFNGTTRSKQKIAAGHKTFSMDDNRWSADGRSAMFDLNIGQEILFVDLENGKTTTVKVGPNSELPPWRSVKFEGWSPDSRAAAVEMTNLWEGAGDDRIFDVDVYEVDLSAPKVTYVGSMRRQRWPYEVKHHWERTRDAYQLVFDSSYRKQKGEFLTF